MTAEEEREEIEKFRKKLENLGLLETLFPKAVHLGEKDVHAMYWFKDKKSGEYLVDEALMRKQTVNVEKWR